jgi:hypothetical protein
VLVLGLGLAIVIVIVLDTRQQLGQRRGRHGLMAFDHEKLDLYRLAVLFSSWVGERLDHRKPAIASGPRHENQYEPR